MGSSNSKFLAYAGIPTFWRSAQSRDVTESDIVVMGIPFDCGTSNRPGARFGAQAIRQMSLHTGNFHHPWDYDVKDVLSVLDYGDVGMSVGPDAIPVMINESYDHAREIFARGARLFTLGGDHTIPYGPVRAAKDHFGEITLVHFDSHQDSLDGENGASIFHGTFSHDLASEGTVNAAASTQVFIRTNMDNASGYNILHAEDTFYMSPKDVAESIKSNAGDSPVYVTFDIDSLDPAYAPGTGTPVPGGPSTAYVRQVFRHMSGMNIIGGDIAEVAPQYDNGDITALAGAVIAGDIIHLMGETLLRERNG